MTIKCCMVCGKGFSTKKSKFEIFCSVECSYEFKNKQFDNEDWLDSQFYLDVKAKQKAQADDYRLLRR